MYSSQANRPARVAPARQREKPPLRATRLLDQLRERIRYFHYALSTERAYVYWVRDFIRWHGVRHPSGMGAAEIEAYLTYLATGRGVSASTHNQALSALLFLYRDVLDVELPWLNEIGRPAQRKRLPVILTRDEVHRLLALLPDDVSLVGWLLFGTGMRLMEGLRLRVKDVDFDHRAIIVREGKGGKDRVVMLPDALAEPLRGQLEKSQALWRLDRESGRPGVYMPDALSRKYPRAAQSWSWHWVFPAPHLAVDPRSGIRRRHHLYEQRLQRAVKRASQEAAIAKPVSVHSLRHAFATTLLQAGYDIRTVQELLGHADVATTMVYTHVLKIGGGGVRSPLDLPAFGLPAAAMPGDDGARGRPLSAAIGAAIGAPFGAHLLAPCRPALSADAHY